MQILLARCHFYSWHLVSTSDVCDKARSVPLKLDKYIAQITPATPEKVPRQCEGTKL